MAAETMSKRKSGIKARHEKSEEISMGDYMKNRLFTIKDTVNCPCKHRLCHDKDLLVRVSTLIPYAAKREVIKLA